MRTRPAVTFLILLLVITAAALLAQLLSNTPLTGYDDADIFFVYARNIAHGHGAVYNVGSERVEGFTSAAWVVICAAVMRVTAHPEPVLLALNIAMIALAAWALVGYLEDFFARFCVLGPAAAQLTAFGVAAAVLLAPGYIVWTTISLMDAGLWCATLLLCSIGVLRISTVRLEPDTTAVESGSQVRLIEDRPLEVVQREQATSRWRRGFLTLIVLLTFVRPEAMLWGPVLLALAVWADWISGRTPSEALRRYAAHIASFVAAVAALTVFRVLYFGYSLPNTYYAKASGGLTDRVREGIPYFLDFLTAHPIFLFSILAGMFALIVSIRAQRAHADWADGRPLIASQMTVLALLLVSSLVPILEGGDHFGLSRMYQPWLPLAAVQTAHTGAALFAAPGRHGRRGGAAYCAVTLLIALTSWTLWPVLPGIAFTSRHAPSGEWSTPRLEMSIAADMREIGASFNRIFPRDLRPSVGVIVAGGFALEYEGETIDLMGLNSVAMAHSPGPRIGFKDHAAFDPGVFFTLSPDVVLLALWSPQRPDWFGFPMMSGVFDAPPDSMSGYWQRRAVSIAAFDSGILKGILSQPRFAAEYTWASVRPRGSGPWAHALFRRGSLAALGARGFEIRFPVSAR